MLQRTDGPRLLRPALAVAFGALLLAGCSRTAGNNSQAETSNTADQAAAGVEHAAAVTKNAVDTAAENAKPAVEKAAAETRHAAEVAKEKAGPAMHKASIDAQRGLGKLSHATGQALEKAGRDLQRAGDNAQHQADRKDTPRADRPTGQ